MKLQIRKAAFETNSSSMHTICISKTNEDLNLPSTLTFYPKEYGWNIDSLVSPAEKASYLYSAILSNYSKKKIERNKNWIYEVLNKNGVIAEFDDSFFSEDELIDYALIDHSRELDSFLDSILKNEKRLLRFLFSDKSYILTGNDNEVDGYNEQEKIRESHKGLEVFEKNN